MTYSLQDRYKTTITNTPGTTGGFILGAPVSNFLSWSSGDDGNTFDIVVDNGTNFEVCANCVYTQSSHSLSRGNFIKSNTGSPINWDGSPTVSNVYIAERMAAFNITSPAPGDSLYWNGSFWINETLEPLPPAILLEGLADVSIIPGTQVAGQVLEWDGAAWTNYTLPTYSLETLTDVVITTPSIGDTIKWTGTDWVNITLSSSNLSDFGLASPSAGQVLQYNGTKWQNLNLSVPWTAVTGAPSLFTPVITSPTSGQDLTYNGTNWVNTNKTIAFSSVTGTPTTLSGYGITDGVSTTTIASYAPLASPALTGSPTSVTATAGSNNTGIATNAFVYTAISGLPLSSTNVSIASPTTNQVLQYNGTNWVNSTSTLTDTRLAAPTPSTAPTAGSTGMAIGSGASSAGSTSIAFGISAAAGSTSAIAIGNNTGTTLTTSPYSIAIGNLSGGTDGSVTLGYQCLANGGVGDAKHSVAIGYKAKAVLHGQVSLGEDALPGSNTSITRYSIIKLSNQTTNATQTNLFLDGTAGTQRLLASSGSMIMAFYIMVVARSTSGAGQAAWKIEGAYSTYGGGAALFGTPTVTALGTPPSGWAVAVTADTVNTGLNVLVTGAASTNINWFATCELTELQ